jgi:hypothetical protein
MNGLHLLNRLGSEARASAIARQCAPRIGSDAVWIGKNRLDQRIGKPML